MDWLFEARNGSLQQANVSVMPNNKMDLTFIIPHKRDMTLQTGYSWLGALLRLCQERAVLVSGAGMGTLLLPTTQVSTHFPTSLQLKKLRYRGGLPSLWRNFWVSLLKRGYACLIRFLPSQLFSSCVPSLPTPFFPGTLQPQPFILFADFATPVVWNPHYGIRFVGISLDVGSPQDRQQSSCETTGMLTLQFINRGIGYRNSIQI